MKTFPPLELGLRLSISVPSGVQAVNAGGGILKQPRSNMLTHETSLQLEAAIDGFSLVEVLEALADICHGKAEHLESNWQDSATAKEWTKAAGLLASATVKAAKLGIPQWRKGGAQ